jgi:hypothetical protein
VDRDAVAASPARGQIRLMRREGDDAAAVEGTVIRSSQLVRNGEAPRRSRRARPADANGHSTHDMVAPLEEKQMTRQVDGQALGSGRQSNITGAHPPVPAVGKPRGDDTEPTTVPSDDAECLRRAKFRRGSQGGDGRASSMCVQSHRPGHLRDLESYGGPVCRRRRARKRGDCRSDGESTGHTSFVGRAGAGRFPRMGLTAPPFGSVR